MKSNDEQVRTVIAEQAAEWLVANDEGPLDDHDSAALAAWLKTSPLHIEEFLGVSAIARDLTDARTDPEYSLEAILARARAEDDPAAQPLRPRRIDAVAHEAPRRWIAATVAMAACALLSLGLLWMRHVTPEEHPAEPLSAATLHLETRHGEQLTHRLADDSVLHLDTDTAVNIRYGKKQRSVTLLSGQAEFEVVHDSDRPFRVFAGPAVIVDLGTQFDVRLERDSAVVTVVEGQVTAGPASMGQRTGSSTQDGAPGFVRLGANQQLRIAQGEWPGAPIDVDAQSATAWLRREMVFDHEPLERVAAEYNRYAPKPIEIATPALRNLLISGVFTSDDPEAFIAFLRSLKGVRVEVTATQIRVW